MKNALIVVLAIALMPVCSYAVDGTALINQSTVMSAGGFPYVISQPGSYKLSGNLIAPVAVDGIHITTSNVTLDLNGFTISSLGTGGFEPRGIVVLSATPVTNITIRNGAMNDWIFAIILTSAGGLGTVENMNIEENFTASDGGTVTNGTALFSDMILRIKGVVSDGGFVVFCPSVVFESAGNTLTRAGTISACSIAVSTFNSIFGVLGPKDDAAQIQPQRVPSRPCHFKRVHSH